MDPFTTTTTTVSTTTTTVKPTSVTLGSDADPNSAYYVFGFAFGVIVLTLLFVYSMRGHRRKLRRHSSWFRGESYASLPPAHEDCYEYDQQDEVFDDPALPAGRIPPRAAAKAGKPGGLQLPSDELPDLVLAPDGISGSPALSSPVPLPLTPRQLPRVQMQAEAAGGRPRQPLPAEVTAANPVAGRAAQPAPAPGPVSGRAQQALPTPISNRPAQPLPPQPVEAADPAPSLVAGRAAQPLPESAAQAALSTAPPLSAHGKARSTHLLETLVQPLNQRAGCTVLPADEGQVDFDEMDRVCNLPAPSSPIVARDSLRMHRKRSSSLTSRPEAQPAAPAAAQLAALAAAAPSDRHPSPNTLNEAELRRYLATHFPDQVPKRRNERKRRRKKGEY